MSGNIHNILEVELRDSRELSASQLHLLLHPTEEEEDERLRRSDQMICLNIGGKRHWVMSRNFVNFPGTRLGRLARAGCRDDREEVLRLCDKYWPGETPEYFFDVSWVGFNSILDVYRRGNLHLSNGVCALVTKQDLEYWGIDELLLEPCCALKYYPEIELCVKEVKGEETYRMKQQQRKAEEDFGLTRWGKVRKAMWNLTEYPETSVAAQAAAFVSLGAVLISTFCFILSTFPELQDPDEQRRIEEEEEEEEKSQAEDPSPPFDFDALRFSFKVVDYVTIVYFTIEYVVRFTCSPNKLKFFFQAMNFVDFLAILPYIITLFVHRLQDLHILGKAGKIMRLARVMRILRIFKLVRHFAGLQSLIYTLKQAYKELGLLIILVGIAVLTFSSLVFFAEKDSPILQWTFLDSFWWGLMTLTTVGYGTQTPQSLTGKAIGGICAIVGVFILTLPVPIVVNSFASYYKNRLWRNEVAHKRRIRAQEQTRMVKEIIAGSRRPSYCGSYAGGGGAGGAGNGEGAGDDAEHRNSCPDVRFEACEDGAAPPGASLTAPGGPASSRHRPPAHDRVGSLRTSHEKRSAFRSLLHKTNSADSGETTASHKKGPTQQQRPKSQDGSDGGGGGGDKGAAASAKIFLDVPDTGLK